MGTGGVSAHDRLKRLFQTDTVPRFLYRYRALRDAFDSVEKILAHNLWWLGSREQFDDQEDMVLPGVVVVPEHVRSLTRARDPGSAPEHGFKIEQYLNDPESPRRLTEAVQDDVDKIGVLCLSEDWRNRELWRLYADDGRGLCLGLESLEVFPPGPSGLFYGPFDVVYRDCPRRPYDPRRAGVPQVEDHLLRKRTRWAYQKEWRFILVRRSGRVTVGYHSLPRGALGHLVFGWRVTERERSEVVGWIRRGPFRPALHEAFFRGSRIRVRALDENAIARLVTAPALAT